MIRKQSMARPKVVSIVPAFVTVGPKETRLEPLEAGLAKGIRTHVPGVEREPGTAEFIRAKASGVEREPGTVPWIRRGAPMVVAEPAFIRVRRHRRSGRLVKTHLRKKVGARWKGSQYKRSDGSWRDANTGRVSTSKGSFKGY